MPRSTANTGSVGVQLSTLALTDDLAQVVDAERHHRLALDGLRQLALAHWRGRDGGGGLGEVATEVPTLVGGVEGSPDEGAPTGL